MRRPVDLHHVVAGGAGRDVLLHEPVEVRLSRQTLQEDLEFVDVEVLDGDDGEHLFADLRVGLGREVGEVLDADDGRHDVAVVFGGSLSELHQHGVATDVLSEFAAQLARLVGEEPLDQVVLHHDGVGDAQREVREDGRLLPQQTVELVDDPVGLLEFHPKCRL